MTEVLPLHHNTKSSGLKKWFKGQGCEEVKYHQHQVNLQPFTKFLNIYLYIIWMIKEKYESSWHRPVFKRIVYLENCKENGLSYHLQYAHFIKADS